MKKPIEVLKTFFETGDKPTEQQFCDLIDSFHHKDSGIVIEDIQLDPSNGTTISLSNGEEINIPNPVAVQTSQNNKIRVVDLPTISTLPITTIPVGDKRRLQFIKELVTIEVNNLNPPLVVAEDEIILFRVVIRFEEQNEE